VQGFPSFQLSAENSPLAERLNAFNSLRELSGRCPDTPQAFEKA
jgi:hypothetical protein